MSNSPPLFISWSEIYFTNTENFIYHIQAFQEIEQKFLYEFNIELFFIEEIETKIVLVFLIPHPSVSWC